MGLPNRSAEFMVAIAAGEVVLFPSDTVYGLAVAADNPEPLYALKGRDRAKPAAIMYFELASALAGVPEATAAVMRRLLPGAVTVVLPDGRGIRVVDVPVLRGSTVAVLQSSANRSGAGEARRLEDVDPVIRAGVSLEIDGGELPGTPSTVVDLRAFERGGHWAILREGAVSAEVIAAALDDAMSFDPDGYAETIRAEIPGYERLQRELIAAVGAPGADHVRRVLDLGTGTGETAAALAEALPEAEITGVDVSAAMLEVAARRLPGAHLVRGRLQDPLPAGSYDLVISALAVHHLTAREKADLFIRVAAELTPGGRFILADVVSVSEPVIELTRGYDKPDQLEDQCRWLEDAGFGEVEVAWGEADLAVISARR